MMEPEKLAENVELNVSDIQTDTLQTPLTKEGIIAELEAILEMPVNETKERVASLKAAFYSIRKQETEAEFAAFLEKGNEESAFAAKEDAFELRLKEILTIIKDKKAEYQTQLENTRRENLEKKEAILTALSEIADDTDNINKLYSRFQQLQQEFKAIGEVAPEHVTPLWKKYQTATEHFYDQLKINKDLRDYDFKKNLEAKELLVKQAEALDAESDVVSAFKKLQSLHDQWREIGPVAPEIREDIWTRFKAASVTINKKHQAFFEAIKAKEQENEKAKTEICSRIEEIDTATLLTANAWEKATESIKGMQEEWKKLGFASKKVNNELFARFRHSCDDFFAKKAEFYKTLKEEASENLKKKEALCEKAEAMKDSKDWKKTTNDFIALQKEWKSVGPTAHRYTEALWKRFITACDAFFEEKEKVLGAQIKTEKENLAVKKSIIATLKEMIENDVEDAAAQVKELVNNWRETGHVPYKDKDKIQAHFNDALKQVNDKYDLKETRARLRNFKEDVEKMSDASKLSRERDRLIYKYDQKINDLRTYETNMNFFKAQSKNGNSLLRDMERKIQLIRDDIAELEQKIRLIEEKL